MLFASTNMTKDGWKPPFFNAKLNGSQLNYIKYTKLFAWVFLETAKCNNTIQ